MERMMDNETFDEVLNGFKEADSIVKRLKTRIAELEEENKKLKEYNGELIENHKKDIAILCEENKNLKLIQETNEKQIQNDIKERDELREEIRTLKECNKSQSEVINNVFIPQKERLEEENKNLKEKVETLELWLDNKEKLNEEYRNQIDLLNYQSYGPSELADSLYDADKANKNLEKRVKELIGKIDQLEEENENLSKDLFHLTNNGKAK